MSRPVVSLPAPASTCGVGEHLVAGQRARRPGLVLELGVEQRGHQVVGGVLGPPVDVVGEHVAVGDGVLAAPPSAARPRCAGWRRCGPGPRPGPTRGCRGACRSPASACTAPSSATMSNRSVPTSGSRQLDAEVAHLVLERGHPPRGEHPRHQAPVHGVHRRVLEHDDARRELHARLDDVEDVAAGSWRSAASRRAPSRRRRGGTAPRSRSARCGRSAPRPGGAGTSGRGRR